MAIAPPCHAAEARRAIRTARARFLPPPPEPGTNGSEGAQGLGRDAVWADGLASRQPGSHIRHHRVRGQVAQLCGIPPADSALRLETLHDLRDAVSKVVKLRVADAAGVGTGVMSGLGLSRDALVPLKRSV